MANKTQALIISALLATATILQGQYLPAIVEGSTWRIHLHYGLGIVNNFDYSIGCDTLIDGMVYHIIVDKNLDTIGFAREDTMTGQIFSRDPDTSIETVFPTLNYEIGDTVKFFSHTYPVTDVRYDTVYGAYRKIVDLAWPFQIIEGVGMAPYGIINRYEPGGFPFPLLNNWTRTDYFCENTTATSVPVSKAPVLIYPNPFLDALHIKSHGQSIISIQVYDLFGRLITSANGKSEYSIPTEGWPAGMYLVRTKDRMMKVMKE